MLALLAGTDLWIVLGIVVLLFGSTQLPKLARSVGLASHEFKKGTEAGPKTEGDTKAGDTKTKEATAEAAAAPQEAPGSQSS